MRDTRQDWVGNRRFLTPAVLLSLGVHGALIVSLVTVFNWHMESEPVYTELWAPEDLSAGKDMEGVAKKLPVDPVPTPQVEPEPEPQVDDSLKLRDIEEKARLEAERQAQAKLREEAIRQAEIAKQAKLKKEAQEKAAREEALKREAERQALEKQKALEAQKRLEAEKEKKRQAELKRQAEEKAKKEAEALRRALRDQELARLQKESNNATQSGTTTGQKGAVKRSLSGKALTSYIEQVVMCVRPHILIDVPPTTPRGRYVAEFQLRLLPTGQPMGEAQQTKSSGWALFDRAVSKAIKQCHPFPTPEPGFDVPRELLLQFDPVDDHR